MMVDEIQNWKTIAAIVHEALRQIDPLLSQENVPISARKLKAFDILQNAILEVPDYEKFWRSTAYGRFLVVIDDWYRDRYGNDAVHNDEDKVFVSALLVHGTPFACQSQEFFKRLGMSQTRFGWDSLPLFRRKKTRSPGFGMETWLAGFQTTSWCCRESGSGNGRSYSEYWLRRPTIGA